MPAPYQLGGGPSRRSLPVPPPTGPSRASARTRLSAPPATSDYGYGTSGPPIQGAGAAAYQVDDWGGTGAATDYAYPPGGGGGGRGRDEGFASPDDVYVQAPDEGTEQQQAQRPKAPGRRPWLGYLIFSGCIAGFAYSLAITPGIIAPLSTNPLIGPTPNSLVASGAKVTCLINQGGSWWRLVSPMWLHAGVIHLLGASAGALVFAAARTGALSKHAR